MEDKDQRMRLRSIVRRKRGGECGEGVIEEEQPVVTMEGELVDVSEPRLADEVIVEPESRIFGG